MPTVFELLLSKKSISQCFRLIQTIKKHWNLERWGFLERADKVSLFWLTGYDRVPGTVHLKKCFWNSHPFWWTNGKALFLTLHAAQSAFIEWRLSLKHGIRNDGMEWRNDGMEWRNGCLILGICTLNANKMLILLSSNTLRVSKSR